MSKSKRAPYKELFHDSLSYLYDEGRGYSQTYIAEFLTLCSDKYFDQPVGVVVRSQVCRWLNNRWMPQGSMELIHTVIRWAYIVRRRHSFVDELLATVAKHRKQHNYSNAIDHRRKQGYSYEQIADKYHISDDRKLRALHKGGQPKTKLHEVEFDFLPYTQRVKVAYHDNEEIIKLMRDVSREKGYGDDLGYDLVQLLSRYQDLGPFFKAIHLDETC